MCELVELHDVVVVEGADAVSDVGVVDDVEVGVGIGVGLVVGLCVNIVVGAGTGGLVRWLPPSSDDDRLIDIISALCRRRSASISPLAILDAFSQMFPISSFDCKDRSNVESNGGSLFRTLEYDFSLSKSSYKFSKF